MESTPVLSELVFALDAALRVHGRPLVMQGGLVVHFASGGDKYLSECEASLVEASILQRLSCTSQRWTDVEASDEQLWTLSRSGLARAALIEGLKSCGSLRNVASTQQVATIVSCGEYPERT